MKLIKWKRRHFHYHRCKNIHPFSLQTSCTQCLLQLPLGDYSWKSNFKQWAFCMSVVPVVCLHDKSTAALYWSRRFLYVCSSRSHFLNDAVLLAKQPISCSAPPSTFQSSVCISSGQLPTEEPNIQRSLPCLFAKPASLQRMQLKANIATCLYTLLRADTQEEGSAGVRWETQER